MEVQQRPERVVTNRAQQSSDGNDHILCARQLDQDTDKIVMYVAPLAILFHAIPWSTLCDSGL
jgi:hypothetical protein